MRDKQDTPKLEIKEIGSAKELTRGLLWITPWLEAAPPPWQYYCPVCG